MNTAARVCVFHIQSRDRNLVFAEVSRDDADRRRQDSGRGRGRDDRRLLFLRGSDTIPHDTGGPTSDPWTVQTPAHQERLLAVRSSVS